LTALLASETPRVLARRWLSTAPLSTIGAAIGSALLALGGFVALAVGKPDFALAPALCVLPTRIGAPADHTQLEQIA
jgi:hypothetical protein